MTKKSEATAPAPTQFFSATTMFSSAVARRVCAPALRPALGAARALPTTGTIISTRMVSQSARQPSPRQPSAPASTTSSLLNRPWAANAGGWNSFLSEVGDSIPGSKRVPARSSERSAQAEGVTAKSEFDAIRESMPGLDVYNTRPRAPQVEDYDEEWRKRSASIVPALVAEGVPDAYSGAPSILLSFVPWLEALG